MYEFFMFVNQLHANVDKLKHWYFNEYLNSKSTANESPATITIQNILIK